MNEQNYVGNETVLRNDAAAGQTIQLDSMADGLPLQESFQPYWAGIILSLTLFGVILMFIIKQMFGSGPFKQSFAAFKRLPIGARAAALSLMVAVISYGGAKPGTNEIERASRPLAVLMNSGEQMETIPEAVQLTESQQLAGFALTAVVTNETFDLSAPTNAVIHANWLKRGAAEDGFWMPIAPFSLGTNRFDSVYVSSSGTLSFNHPKSSPLARLMPDGSTIAFLAPLQTVLGLPPEANWNLLSATNSLFWHDVTTYGSSRFTWQNALLNRATNAPLSFQTELFPSGDFIYRYDFSSLTPETLPLASDFVMGAQNNGGGETALIATDTHSCSGTNHLCALLYRLDGTNVTTAPLCSVATNSPKFSLYWTAFGEFDSANPDPDDDGITTADEVLLYHTDPHMPDSDLDGVSDGDEITLGINPLIRDTDNDGLVDGSDPDPLATTSLSDLDADGIPDAYEVFMFGSTDTVGSLAYDPNGTGFPLSTKIAAGMNPSVLPAEVTIPTNNLASLKLFDGFRCDFTNTPRVIYSRTLSIDRDGGWQQYFLSSAPDKAKGWNLQGMILEWEDSAGGSGSVTASPEDDSFYLPVSTNSPSQLTLTLRTTSTHSVCPQPLYLLTWSPGIDASGTAQATLDGSLCYAVEWEGESMSVGIGFDFSNRPCNALPTALELSARSNPFPDVPNLMFSPDANLTGGSLFAKAPGAYAMPNPITMDDAEPSSSSSSMPLGGVSLMGTASTDASGNGENLFIFFDPDMTYGDGHSGGCGSVLLFDSETATYSETYDYPLNSKCLWRNWHRDATGAYQCSCKPEITFGDESLSGYFSVDIDDDGHHATGIIKFGGNPVWNGEAWHQTAGDCSAAGSELLSSDECGDCSSGCADGNCDDLEGDDLGSLAFRIPLGTPRASQISGFLWFKTTEPLFITQATFNLLIRDDANVTAVTNNGIRLVTCSDERGRTASITNIANGVRITIRKTADNSLEHTWEITNVNGNTNQVQIQKISRIDNIMHDVTYTYNPVGEWSEQPEWTRLDNISGSSEIAVRIDGLNDPQSGILHEERIVRDANDAILSHTLTGSRRFGFGENAVIREVYHSELGIGEDWVNDYASYWEDNDYPERNGKPRLVGSESRAWQYQTWDEMGRETLRLDPWNASEAQYVLQIAVPVTLDTLPVSVTAMATVSDYTPLAGDSNHLDDIDSVRTESRYVVRSGTPSRIGRTWHVYTHGTDSVGRATATVQTIRACSQSAQIGDAGNAVSTETHFDSDAEGIPLLLHGRPVSSTDENGVTTSYDYALGEYNSSTHAFTLGGSASHLRTLVSTSTAAAPNGIPGKSTKSLTIQDAVHGNAVYTATLLGSTGDVLSWQANAYDDKNRLRFSLYSDGSSTTNAYSCCRLLSKIDRNGYTTLRSAETGKDHLYYAMEEISLAELPGGGNGHRVTQHFRDALGRETNTVVTAVVVPGSANVPDCATTWSRSIEETTYPDGTSDYAVHTDQRGVRTVTMNRSFADREESVALTYHPTNLAVNVLTSTNVTWRNGRSASLRSWAGGWTRETSLIDYTADGTRCAISFAEASDSTGSITNRITHDDFLGRTVASLAPGPNGGWLITSNAYEGATSRLNRSETTGQPAVTYLYDALGESVATVQSGITSASENRYEMIGNEVWQVAVRSSSSDGVTNAVSIIRRQMTGLSNALRSRSVSIAASGSTTTEESSFNPQTCELTTVRTTDAATPAVGVSKFGRAVRRQSLREAVYNYFDPLGRVNYFEERHPMTDEFLYDRWSEFDEAGNEIYHDAFYGELFVTGSKTFDAFNRETTRTDALGNTVTNAYDVLGRPVASSGATYPVRNGYDTMGRMKELGTTRDGLVWDWTGWLYDPVTGLATNKVYANASRIAYTHSPDGKPLRTTWARGEWREQAYNADGLLAATTYSDATPAISLTYDDLQRLAAASNAVAAYVYANSNLGTATNEMATVCGEVYTLTRRLDDHHRLASLGVGNAPVQYGYDAENRLDTVSNDVFAVDYAYTSDGWDAGYAISLTNGVVLSRALTHDSYRRGLIKTITNTVDNVPVTPLAYNYDLLNRAIYRNSDSFAYNDRSEVTAASILSNGYAYAYDGIGNHTTSTVDAVETTFAANSLNQYTAILCAPAPLREPIFDMDGNMLTNGVWSYTWDADNRMIATYSNTVCVVSNAYDYMSRRVVKWTPSHTTTFVYDGWNLVQEIIQKPQSTITNHFVWGKDLSGGQQGAGGVGGLLAVFLNGTCYFPFYDNNGNINAYVDESGSIVAEHTYDAFGETIAQSGSMADTFHHRFSTKYYDEETGLYYYGMRFYSPDLHRWLNRDPIEEDGGLNLYGFCGNDPLGFYDILGNDWLDDTANFSAGVADSLSFGLTRLARRGINRLFFEDNWNDLNVNPSSGAYIAGETTEVVVEIAVTAGSASLRHIAKRTSRAAIEGGARKTFRRAIGKVNAGGYVHHINPIRSGRFPLPFKSSARGHWNMTWIGSRSEHLAAHSYLRRLDALEDARTMTLGIRQAGNELALFLEKENPCWDSIDIRMSIIEEAYSDQSDVSGTGSASAFFFITQ